MADEVSVFLIPGMRLKVTPVLDNTAGSRGIGFFATFEGSVKYKGKTYDLTYGFGLEDLIVGNIKPLDGYSLGVMYTHERPEKNHIYFFALTGQMGIVSVIAVPIHDHSSIVQGGPAYATYFNDNEIIS